MHLNKHGSKFGITNIKNDAKTTDKESMNVVGKAVVLFSVKRIAPVLLALVMGLSLMLFASANTRQARADEQPAPSIATQTDSQDVVQVELNAITPAQTIPQTYVYTGSEIRPIFELTYNGITLKENIDYTVDYKDNTRAGTATVTFAATQNSNFTGTKEVQFVIEQATVVAPVVRTGLVYDGSTQTGVTDSADVARYVWTGVRSSVNAGSYTATATLRDSANYKWADGTVGVSKTFNWSIDKATVVPPRANAELVYTGAELTGVNEGSNYTLAGNKAITAGSHTATATLISTTNYKWSTTGLSNPVTITWSIDKATIVPPTAKIGLVYDGSLQTGVDGGANYSITGNTAIAAGSHSATATLNDTTNYKWSTTGLSNPVTITWSIDKATIVPPTAKAGLVYNKQSQVGVIDSADVAQYAWTGATTGVNAGTYTATATLADASNYKWSDGTLASTKTFVWSIAGIDLGGAKAAIVGSTQTDDTVSMGTYVYVGVAIKPAFVLTYDGNALDEGVDYDIEYSSNLNAGTATVTFTARTGSNFTGIKVAYFTISQENIANATLAMGSDARPQVSMTLSNSTRPIALILGTDYTASYRSDNTGNKTIVTITGKGNFSGTKSQTFDIKMSDIPATDDPTNDPTKPIDDPTTPATPNVTFKGKWNRLNGADRLDTMKQITQAGFPTEKSCDKIILANAMNYADALSASSLAGAWNCPIITTMPTEFSQEAKDEITRLAKDGATVYILGGTSAVSTNIENQIKAMGVATERIAGELRTDTSLKIYEQGKGSWGSAEHKTAIVTNAWNYADALSIGSWAAVSKSPIFGTTNGELSSAAVQAIRNGGFDQILVLGGNNAVNFDLIKSQFADKQITRLAGASRLETSALIVNWSAGALTSGENIAFTPTENLNLDGIAITTALNFPDALVAVNVTGRTKSPVLLVCSDTGANANISKQNIEKIVNSNSAQIKNSWVLGGTSAVSPEVVSWVR